MDEVNTRINAMNATEIGKYLELAKLNTGMSDALKNASKEEVLRKVSTPTEQSGSLTSLESMHLDADCCLKCFLCMSSSITSGLPTAYL